MTSWGAVLLLLFVILGLRKDRRSARVYTVAKVATIVVLVGVALRQHTL